MSSDNFEKSEVRNESTSASEARSQKAEKVGCPGAISQPQALSSMLRHWCRIAELTAMLGREKCKAETGEHNCEPLNLNEVATSLGNAILDLMLLTKWANTYAAKPGISKAVKRRSVKKSGVPSKSKTQSKSTTSGKASRPKAAGSIKKKAGAQNVFPLGIAKRIEKGKVRIRQAMENISEAIFDCKFYMPLWTQVVVYVRQELAKKDDSDECLRNPHPLSLETFVAAGKKIKEALDLKLSQRTLITAGLELRRIYQAQGKQIPTPQQMEQERKNKRAQPDV